MINWRFGGQILYLGICVGVSKVIVRRVAKGFEALVAVLVLQISQTSILYPSNVLLSFFLCLMFLFCVFLKEEQSFVSHSSLWLLYNPQQKFHVHSFSERKKRHQVLNKQENLRQHLFCLNGFFCIMHHRALCWSIVGS